MAQRNLFRLRQFLRSNAIHFDLFDDFQDEIARGVALLEFHSGIDAEQTRIARSIGKRRHAVGQARFLAQLPVEPGAAAIAEDGREKIERRHIGMGDLGNVPRERETRQLGDKFLMHFAPAKLRRFGRDENRRQRFGRIIFEKIAELLMDRVRVNVADDDEGEIVRHVTRAVILEHVVARELIENIEQADNRQPVRMTLIGGSEEELSRHSVRIVHAHGELAPDHFLFLGVFFRGQGRVHHRIGEDIERNRDAVLRDVDPIDGAIERRVGIDVTAHVLDLLRDRICRVGFRSLEEHVLEDVRQARAEMRVFIHAAGAAPGLDTRHRRAPVFLDDDRQAVRQDAFLRRARRERDPGAGLRRGGFKMRAQHTGTPKGGTACSSTQDNFGVGVGSRTGISGCEDFSGSNGFTNAS